MQIQSSINSISANSPALNVSEVIINISDIQNVQEIPESNSAVIPEKIEPPETNQSVSAQFKSWVELHIDALADKCQFIYQQLSDTYGTINPLLILQCKVGSSTHLGALGSQPVSGWAQNGFQMNLISRGINFCSEKPIIQLFLHNEMGISCVASGMNVLNTGICLVPNANGHYSVKRTSFITEEVHRLDYGDAAFQHSAESQQIALKGSVGLDVLEHHYWTERNKWLAGPAIMAAQAGGTALGWFAGSFLDAAVGPLTGLGNATTSSVITTSNPSFSISAMDQRQAKYQWGDLGASLGGIYAAKCIIGVMKSTPCLAPENTLSMKELTFGFPECGFEMPLSNGQTLYLMAFPRFNLTSINKNTLTNETVVANARVTKKKVAEKTSDLKIEMLEAEGEGSAQCCTPL